jgi:hypothetical protein
MIGCIYIALISDWYAFRCWLALRDKDYGMQAVRVKGACLNRGGLGDFFCDSCEANVNGLKSIGGAFVSSTLRFTLSANLNKFGLAIVFKRGACF